MQRLTLLMSKSSDGIYLWKLSRLSGAPAFSWQWLDLTYRGIWTQSRNTAWTEFLSSMDWILLVTNSSLQLKLFVSISLIISWKLFSPQALNNNQLWEKNTWIYYNKYVNNLMSTTKKYQDKIKMNPSQKHNPGALLIRDLTSCLSVLALFTHTHHAALNINAVSFSQNSSELKATRRGCYKKFTHYLL